jgi:prevent-host-death family protein
MVANAKNITVPASDVGGRMKELLERVAQGGHVTITADGRPVARLLPAETERDEAQVRKAFEELNAIAKHSTLGGLKIKDLINEGRR